MKLAEAYRLFLEGLFSQYDKREARQIAAIVFEKITGYAYSAFLLHEQDELSPDKEAELNKIKTELLAGVPLQYVLEEAWFAAMPFYVNKSVLIPRPETEELVEWALQHAQAGDRILDIGTGSGCIAIALKKQKPSVEMWAVDKYADVLAVAGKNAAALNADIQFPEVDVLQDDWFVGLPKMDMLISNPPYIPASERKEMHLRVTEYEPAAALFVTDERPLVFYEAVLDTAKKLLNSGGKVFVEIHEELGAAVKELFEKQLSNVVLKTDLSGKDRMVFGQKN